MSEWIEWSGGECPVDPDTLVEVKWGNPNRRTMEAVPAQTWSEAPYEWSITDQDNEPDIQIVAYRVVP